jgi:adenosylcobinamide-GDP ribazoletransferase
VPRTGALSVLPLVGIVLGALAGTIGWLASLITPLPLAVVVAFAASIILTGAIHLDGFLDACDALFASVSPERRLEILKDPRHGTYALAGLAIVVPAWLGALIVIPPGAWPWSLAFCAGTARLAAVLNAFRVPYVRGGASAGAFEERPSIALLVLAALASAACAWSHPWLAAAVPATIVLALALGAWCARQLGGVMAGDAYGAIIVVLETVVLGTVAVTFGRPGI